ncbi:MAG: methionine adenosyltransferase [Candidatus Micrarchaeales archaeon]|nr:methionine adenosyltransferase [Candidatus Micrarchaeales archaeon]
MPDIRIVESFDIPAGEQPVEYVERKGKGHPDTLMDGIVEAASLELSKYYLDYFGTVLHHNVDKGLLVGGSADVSFGKGIITKPIEIIIAGRATESYQNERIPVDELCVRAAKEYLRENTRFLDLDDDVKISTKILKGSESLNKIFSRSVDVPLANDTSFGVGYAPLSVAERLTLETERFLNSYEYKNRMPAVGEDIKVFCIRENGKLSLNVAAAFVAQLAKSKEEYFSLKKKVIEDVAAFAKGIARSDVEVVINSGDSEERGEAYITKSGLSCESGDDGQPGRGNRANGLITPFRQMSIEATAGKNPASHTGKIYNVLAREIAAEAVNLYPQIKECTVSLVSYIGRRIDEPRDVTVALTMQKGEKADAVRSKVRDIADDMLTNIGYVTRGLADGKYSVF